MQMEIWRYYDIILLYILYKPGQNRRVVGCDVSRAGADGVACACLIRPGHDWWSFGKDLVMIII